MPLHCICSFSGEGDEVPRGGKGQRQVPRFHREGQPLHLPSGFYSTTRGQELVLFLSGPRTYEPVADEAAPDHEDDLPGLKTLF